MFSLDFKQIPPSLERDTLEYAEEHRLSPEQAFVEIFMSGLEATHFHSKATLPISEEDIERLKSLDPGYGLLADVPDERLFDIEATIHQMKQEELSLLA